jgi:hypothetical protein
MLSAFMAAAACRFTQAAFSFTITSAHYFGFYGFIHLIFVRFLLSSGIHTNTFFGRPFYQVFLSLIHSSLLRQGTENTKQPAVKFQRK